MSAATIAIAVEGALLALALLFVVALLRSHAEILRRLESLEHGGATPFAAAGAGVPAAAGLGGANAGGANAGGATAGGIPVGDILGQTLAGDAVKIGLGSGSPRTLLAFLSSGCASCEPLWSDLHGPSAPRLDARLVVVTKGPERERLARLQELAPSTVDVVMSTAAWDEFAVPATPHFVLVAGEAGVIGRGGASSWEQIAGLMRDARDDSALHRARTTADRAARAEQALAASGIAAGHASLYPSRRTAEDRQ